MDTLPGFAAPPRVSRRAVLAGGLGVTAGLASGLLTATAARADGGSSTYTQRARASYAALQRYFYDAGTSFYLEEYPHTSGNPWSYVWPFSQAMIATQTMAGLPGIGAGYRDDVADRYEALEAYWNSETDPPGYD